MRARMDVACCVCCPEPVETRLDTCLVDELSLHMKDAEWSSECGHDNYLVMHDAWPSDKLRRTT